MSEKKDLKITKGEEQDQLDSTLIDILDSFIIETECLQESLNITLQALNENFEKNFNDFKLFIKSLKTKDNSYGEEKTTIPITHYKAFVKKIEQGRKDQRSLDIIPRSFLNALISQFDSFISDYLCFILAYKPGLIYAISEKNIPLKEILTTTDIEHLKNKIIEKEVDALMRDNHENQIKWFEDKLNCKIFEGIKCIEDFIEITERRNLFVHNNGIVNHFYLNKTGNSEYKLGETLKVDADYFQNAVNVLLEIAIKLFHISCRKIKLTETSLLDKNLQELGYKFLENKNYDLCKNISEFALDSKLCANALEKYKLVNKVNFALALKAEGDESQAIKYISNEDWSAKSFEFQLAQAVIVKDFDKAIKIMKSIGTNELLISKSAYIEWPLFDDFRELEIFRTTFKEIYKLEWLQFVEECNFEKIQEANLDKLENHGAATED